MEANLRAALPKEICGVPFYPRSLGMVREIIHTSIGHSRKSIIRQCCEELGWINQNGQPKVSSARPALLRMHEKGWIELPKVRDTHSNPPSLLSLDVYPDPLPIESPLSQLQEITLQIVSTEDDARLWRTLMERHHYLGGPRLFGAQLRYLVKSRQGVLGAMSFSAAAARLQERDCWIGWNGQQRRNNRHLLLNNSRFLILPGVQVPNLASHLLSKAAKQLPDDFEKRYGYRPLLLESFVEEGRYTGTCYRAANWVEAGRTRGIGRADLWRERSPSTTQQSNATTPVPIKTIWLYPLVSINQLRKRLCNTPPVTTPSATTQSTAA